jgi:hypothetical protein
MVTFAAFGPVARMDIPGLIMGGALIATAGEVPIGAEMIIPGRDPGGGGMKTPDGPVGRGPTITPGRAWTSTTTIVWGGGTNTDPWGRQCPETKITMPFRFS